MKAGRLVLLIVGVILFQSQYVLAAEPGAVVKLASRSKVSHAEVTLGDISEITGTDQHLVAKLRSLRLGAAPFPGYNRRIDVAYLQSRVRSEGLSAPVEFAGPRSAVVETPRFEIAPERMKVEVEHYVNRAWSDETGEVAVEFPRPPQAVAVPSETAELRVLPGNSSDLRGNASVLLGIFVDGRLYKKVPVSARIRTFEMVAVAGNKILRHHILTGDDITFEMRETTSLRHTPIRSADDMLGMRAKRTIGVGRVLDGSMLEVPPVIKRGDRVSAVARVRNVTVKVPAIAKEDGRVGDIISVTNVDSRRKLFARVENSEMVAVIP